MTPALCIAAHHPAVAPWCVEHGTAYEWLDGSPLPHYADGFAPLGWVCPCDPGHPVSDAQGGTE